MRIVGEPSQCHARGQHVQRSALGEPDPRTSGKPGTTAGKPGTTAGESGTTAGESGVTAGEPGAVAEPVAAVDAVPGSGLGRPRRTARPVRVPIAQRPRRGRRP